MPKPFPSTYPTHQRWRFIQRAITDNELVSFANTLVSSNNTDIDKSLPKILRFLKLQTKNINILKNEHWLKIWVNIMHQAGLGYTVTLRANNETRVIATDLSRYVADTKNIAAYYYYWALRFQFPFSVPKHRHYIKNKVAIQPVVLICQHLDLLAKVQKSLQNAYLSKYEIAQFLMKSTGHSQSVIRNNCAQIIGNRKKKYNYDVERMNPEFEETANHLFSRGRLFIEKFNLLEFHNDTIVVSNVDTLTKLRAFISYSKPPFPFSKNSQDVRNQFFLEAYFDLDPDPDILFDNVNSKIQNPSGAQGRKAIAKPQGIVVKVVNPKDMRGTFGSGTRAERMFQQKLRRDMILMYNGRCCICGLDRQEFLVASHIIPVKIDPSIAADRRNCLLLCLMHDRALEKGYLSLQADYTVIVNHDKSSGHPILVRDIAKREGQKIQLPQNKTLSPSIEYLRRHRISHGLTA